MFGVPKYTVNNGQGLSMGEMLMVNFRQPCHEFTFRVGMNYISYTLLLTHLI
jgi:hypothetical protein